MNSDVAALYIDSLNEVTGIHALRVALGIQARLPSESWLVLYCITILGMMGVGYQTGIAGSKRSMARQTTMQLNDIVLRGYLLSIEEGSAAKRVAIGFGSGASELRTIDGARATETRLWHPRLRWQ